MQRQFEQLKAKLGDEGLFDPDKKRPVPASTGHIGIITSTTGAAIKDILSVLKRRFPAIKISIFPTAVQGDEASVQIVKALADANSCQHCFGAWPLGSRYGTTTTSFGTLDRRWSAVAES